MSSLSSRLFPSTILFPKKDKDRKQTGPFFTRMVACLPLKILISSPAVEVQKELSCALPNPPQVETPRTAGSNTLAKPAPNRFWAHIAATLAWFCNLTKLNKSSFEELEAGAGEMASWGKGLVVQAQELSSIPSPVGKDRKNPWLAQSASPRFNERPCL